MGKSDNWYLSQEVLSFFVERLINWLIMINKLMINYDYDNYYD